MYANASYSARKDTWSAMEEGRLVEEVYALARGKRDLLVCNLTIHLPFAIVANPLQPAPQYAVHVTIILHINGPRGQLDTTYQGFRKTEV